MKPYLKNVHFTMFELSGSHSGCRISRCLCCAYICTARDTTWLRSLCRHKNRGSLLPYQPKIFRRETRKIRERYSALRCTRPETYAYTIEALGKNRYEKGAFSKASHYARCWFSYHALLPAVQKRKDLEGIFHATDQQDDLKRHYLPR